MTVNRVLRLAAYLFLFSPTFLHALTVDIQGTLLTPKNEGDACIDITGDYEGLRVEASETGKAPQICFNNAKQNTLDIHDVNIVAKGTPVSRATIIIEHTFPPGPNGLITVRNRIFGFFSTANGTGVAKGDTIRFTGFFSQNDHFDQVAEPFEHTVGETLDSAIFELDAKKQYIIAGQRTLKGVLNFSFSDAGHKLTFPLGTSISLDTGSTFDDKLDSLSVTPEFGEVTGEDVAGDDLELGP